MEYVQMKLPRCFFTMSVDGVRVGTVVFELCADICPRTCENFICLCTGEKGIGSMGKPLTYKDSICHRQGSLQLMFCRHEMGVMKLFVFKTTSKRGTEKFTKKIRHTMFIKQIYHVLSLMLLRTHE
eukprot:sb/3475540/